mgnify:CR=1 FL=1
MEIREIVKIALARFENYTSEESRCPGFKLIDSILDATQGDFSDLFIPFLNEKVIPGEVSKNPNLEELHQQIEDLQDENPIWKFYSEKEAKVRICECYVKYLVAKEGVDVQIPENPYKELMEKMLAKIKQVINS